MRDKQPPRQGFVRLVRSALAHLYDEPYLQNHTLAFELDIGDELDQATRAQRLRSALLDCIEQLRPQRPCEAGAPSARAYAILSYRYLDGLTTKEIANRLALSSRQVYREHDKGIRAVACLLQDRMGGAPPTIGVAEKKATDRRQTAQAEVERLRQSARPEPLDLQELVESSIRLVAPLTEQRGVHVRTTTADSQFQIVADRVMLRQALTNLLSYAVAHVAQAELTVTLSSEKGALLVDVSTDMRLPVSAYSTMSTTVNLEVARALIEAQGGRLEKRLLDGVWRGRIWLPTAAPAAILVIDDNADLIALIQRYLGGREVSVVGATGGAQALHLAGELQPQAIILDVLMPSQDGWEVLQQLKASPNTRNIPIIVCSVLNEPQIALAMGATGYITKPVSQAALLEALRPWLGTLGPSA